MPRARHPGTVLRRILLGTTAGLLTLAGCAAPSSPAATDAGPTDAGTTATESPSDASAGPALTDDAAAFLAEHDLTGLGAADIVDRLDRLALEDRGDLVASVRADEVILADGAAEVAVPLPADRFYVAVAPYVDQTHECFFHSPTTCLGELGGEEVHVRVVDDAGEVLADEELTTFANGFVGLWLPRDVEGTIEVTHDGRTGAAPFATTDDGATCLTTLQLA